MRPVARFQDLSEDKLREIVEGIMEAHNIKILPDTAESALYMMVLRRAFKEMDEHLPKWVVHAILSATHGTFGDTKDLNKLIQTLVDDIHEIVDRWWLPDSMEKDFIETLLNVAFHFTRKGVGLEDASANQVRKITEELNA